MTMLKLCLLVLCINGALAANILYVAPMASPSHHIWNRALALGLVDKGHNVTHLGPDPEKIEVVNYTHILLEGIYEVLEQNYDMNGLSSSTALQMMYEFQRFIDLGCRVYAKSQGLQKLLSYPKNFKFDLIVFDITAAGCLFPLIQTYNYPPTVAVVPFLLPPYVGHNFGNHLYPAYIPFYGLSYTNRMSFTERVWNFIYSYLDVYLKHPRNQKLLDILMKEVFGEDAATLEDIEQHISLVLANIDFVFNYPQPIAPNIKAVGGLHTRSGKKLPQDLETTLDNAKEGVIVFSLGTNVRSDKLDKKTRQALLDAFSQLKETVIWKFESEIDNLPKNVVVRKFLPQNDVLGHPNVKLFIGHGGSLSTFEALYHGVPIIAVPFFLDQIINADIIIEKELGLVIDFTKLTAEEVQRKIREVIDNPKYTKNMRETSKRFKGQPETPLERGIFWIEYVLKHGGADFLNTPARKLPFYVASSLDVVAFLAVITLIFLIIIFRIILFTFKFFIKKSKTKKE